MNTIFKTIFILILFLFDGRDTTDYREFLSCFSLACLCSAGGHTHTDAVHDDILQQVAGRLSGTQKLLLPCVLPSPLSAVDRQREGGTDRWMCTSFEDPGHRCSHWKNKQGCSVHIRHRTCSIYQKHTRKSWRCIGSNAGLVRVQRFFLKVPKKYKMKSVLKCLGDP